MSSTKTITAAKEVDVLPSLKVDYGCWLKPNGDFVPPKGFKYPDAVQEVPLNPSGPTELPWKLHTDFSGYKWEKFLPFNTITSEPDLEQFEFDDRGSHADPEKKALLEAIPSIEEITPKFGSEVRGVQLSSMTPRQLDEIALLVAERGVVIFRDQDLAERGTDFMRSFGSYYGQLHCHPWAAHPKDVPDITVVFRNSTKGQYLDKQTRQTFNTLAWHHDMSYELNPTGLSFLTRLEGPASGGDTLYVDMCEAYDRLSPQMQAFLETLQVVHSATEQFKVAETSTWSRRACVKDTLHPLVRTHPVTGRKALYINKEYCRKIEGLKKEESDAILDMLYKHLYTGIDFHLRAKWANGTVVAYDNRTTCHSAILDYPLENGGLRHLARLAVQSERPFLK